MPFLALGVIAAIVFIQEGQRRIPIQYAKRVIGRRMSSGGQTYLPLRVNMAGVIPVIFAASIMAFPPTVGAARSRARKGSRTSSRPNGWAYIVGETVFIILFTYFYTAVTFNPVDQADNLKKYGGFIPGVRPGRPDGRVPRPHPRAPDVPRRAVPGRRRGAADDPDQPDVGQLLLRRHVDPDRRRRRARHHEAARGAADDAQLRGLPEVGRGPRPRERAQPHPARPARAPARARRPSACRTTSACPTSRTGDLLREHQARAPSSGRRPAYMDARRARARRSGHPDDPRARSRPRAPTASCSTASRARSPQADALAEALEERGRRLTAALSSTRPTTTVVQRLSGRRAVHERATSTTWSSTRRRTTASATSAAAAHPARRRPRPSRSASGSRPTTSRPSR